MNDLKIVFTGPPNAGKTTAIGAVSDRPPVKTDVRNTDATLGKELTTVGLDFGQVALGDGLSVRLFGTPGQERFEFMWRILANDALGLVILLDNSRPDPLRDFETYLEAYRDILPSMNCVAGIGRTDSHPNPPIDAFCDRMADRGFLFPVLPVDVRRRDDTLMLIDALISQAEARA